MSESGVIEHYNDWINDWASQRVCNETEIEEMVNESGN
jgi:hypothetical protein